MGRVRVGMRLSLALEDGRGGGSGLRSRSGLAKLIDDERSSDMTITCKDRVFKVHKNILSAQSSVISRLLTSGPGSVTSDSYNVTDDEAESETRKASVISDAYVVTDDETEPEVKDTAGIRVSNNSSGVSIDTLGSSSSGYGAEGTGKQNLEMLDMEQGVVMEFLDFLYTGHYGLIDHGTVESLLSLSNAYQVGTYNMIYKNIFNISKNIFYLTG